MEPLTQDPAMSADYKHPLEDVFVSFVVNGQEFKLDLFETEMVLEEIDITKNPAKEYVPLFQKWMQTKELPALSFSQVCILCERVRYAYIAYKKKSGTELQQLYPSVFPRLEEQNGN